MSQHLEPRHYLVLEEVNRTLGFSLTSPRFQMHDEASWEEEGEKNQACLPLPESQVLRSAQDSLLSRNWMVAGGSDRLTRVSSITFFKVSKAFGPFSSLLKQGLQVCTLSAGALLQSVNDGVR